MIIRKANKKDIDSILKLWLESIKFHKKFDKNMYSIDGNILKDQKDSIYKAINDKKRRIFVVESNGQAVAYVWGLIKKQKKRKIGVIADIIVTKKYRNKGVGKSLIKKILRFFKEFDCESSSECFW